MDPMKATLNPHVDGVIGSIVSQGKSAMGQVHLS